MCRIHAAHIIYNMPYSSDLFTSFSDYSDHYGFIPGAIAWLWNEITGRNKERETNSVVPAAQLQAQENERDVMQLQQRYHEQNLVNDPSLMMEGFQKVGINGAAAAQAILGSQSSFAPSGSSVGAVQPSSSPSVLPQILTTLMQYPLMQAQAANLGADTAGKVIDNASKPVVTQIMVDEAKQRINKSLHDMQLDDRQIAVTEALAESTLSLNDADLQLKYEELNKMHEEVNKLILEQDLLTKYSLHELIKMSYTRSKITKTHQDTLTSAAQASLYRQETNESFARQDLAYQQSATSAAEMRNIESRTEGQDIQNDIASVERTMKQYRLECSKILGVEVDAPEVTQYLESLLTGQDAYITKAFEMVKGGYINDINRMTNTVTGHTKRQRNIRHTRNNTSLQPLWNP